MRKFSVTSTYQFYKKTATEKHLQRDDYNKIANLYCNFLAKNIVDGYSVRLPSGMGTIEVVGRLPLRDKEGKLKKPIVNRGKTLKLWERKPELKDKKFVYCTNEHSNFYVYKIKWFKGNIVNKHLTVFKSARGDKTATDSSIRTRVSNNIIKGFEYRIYEFS